MCEEADANYRANAEKKKLKYSKRKRVTHIDFSEGDFVTIRAPKIDRSSTDQPRLVAKVVQCKGTADKSYRLQCKHGFMDGWYRTGDLMPYEQEYDVPMGEKAISLREASRMENPKKVDRKDQDQDQDSLLVKRRNDNHSPGPVIMELVPSSHQRSELSNTILCIFSG